MGFESNQDPQFSGSSLGDMVDMGRPAKTAGEYDTQQACLVDDFKGFGVREVEVREEVLCGEFGCEFGFRCLKGHILD